MTTDSPLDPPDNSRRMLRIGLRSALLIVLCIAGLFASYRMGYQQGRRLGPIVPSTLRTTQIYSRQYDVADIIASEKQAAMVIDVLQETVEPDSWDLVGGYGVVNYDPKTSRIEVSHVWLGHVGVLEFLTSIRDYAAEYPNLEATMDQLRENP